MGVVLSQKRQSLVALAPTVFGHVAESSRGTSWSKDRFIGFAPGTAVSPERMLVFSQETMFVIGTSALLQLNAGHRNYTANW